MLKVHPKHLSNMRLLSLWREGLYGQKQLQHGRPWADFENTPNPLQSVGSYLSFIASEGLRRGLKFNHELILIPNFEEHLMNVPYSELFTEIEELNSFSPVDMLNHPVFKVIN